jgi:hypothetical protein
MASANFLKANTPKCNAFASSRGTYVMFGRYCRAASSVIISAPFYPAEMIEKIRAYIDMGLDHLVFHAPNPDQARFLKLFSEQVIPILR